MPIYIAGDIVYLLYVYTDVCNVCYAGCLRSGTQVQFCSRGKETVLNQYKYRKGASIKWNEPAEREALDADQNLLKVKISLEKETVSTQKSKYVLDACKSFGVLCMASFTNKLSALTLVSNLGKA